jgi:3-isopropylmalate dehydratase small subunit
MEILGGPGPADAASAGAPAPGAPLHGRAWTFGRDVDTDLIIPARYLNMKTPEELAQHVMEDADPAFAVKVRPGDIIVAQENFGCGSSREHAPLALKGAGISVVIARSFARIFYRNAFNIGLPILISTQAAAAIKEGDELEVDLASGHIRDLTSAKAYQAEPLPEFMRRLVAAGGLLPYLKERAG